MKLKYIFSISIILLSLLFIPTALAKESYHFSSNDSAVLAKIYGTNITTAQFMEKLYPGSLKVLPKDTVERLKTEPMVWPDPKKIRSAETQMNATKSSKSNTVDGKVIINDIINNGIYSVTDLSVQTPYKSSGQIGYMSYTKVTRPTSATTIPEISVTSYIYRDGGTSPIATSTEYGFNTNEEIADGITSLSRGYHSYYTAGYHYVVWPVGSFPPYQACQTATAYQWINY